MNYLLTFTSTTFIFPIIIFFYIFGFKMFNDPYVIFLSILSLITSVISVLNWYSPQLKYIQSIDILFSRFSAIIFSLFGFTFINFLSYPFFLINWFIVIISYLISYYSYPNSFYYNLFHTIFHLSVSFGMFSVFFSILY